MSDPYCPFWGIKKSRACGHNSDRAGLQLSQKELLRDSKQTKGSPHERQSLKANGRAEAR
jgi:hypothetical protein